MIAVLRGGPMSVREAADALRVRASTVSKMTNILEKNGFVARTTDGADARRVRIALTAAGVEVGERVAAAYAALEADLALGLGGDVRAVAAALGRLDEVLAARLRRLR